MLALCGLRPRIEQNDAGDFVVLRGHLPQAGPSSKVQSQHADYVPERSNYAGCALALSKTIVILLHFEGTSRKAGPSSKVQSQNADYVPERSNYAGCALALNETIVTSDAACPVGIPPKLRSLNAAYVQEKCA